MNNNNVDIKDVLNLKNFAIAAINNKKYKNNVSNNFEESISNFKIDGDKVVTKLNVHFERKNKKYTKIIFCIMSKEMENNINSNNNTQYFADVTYCCIPPNNKKFKLFTLLAFNKEKYHSTLCNLSMISNENTETFYTLFDYLKNKYNFKPKNITIDFSIAEYYGFKKVFNNIIIIPCFFHFGQSIVRDLLN